MKQIVIIGVGKISYYSKIIDLIINNKVNISINHDYYLNNKDINKCLIYTPIKK